MTFELKQISEIQQVEIGVLYNWSTYDPDHSNEPLVMMVEGGMTKDVPEWTAMMHKVDDDSAKLNSISVFLANFSRSSCASEDSLDFGIEEMSKEVVSSVKKKRAKWLKLRFRNPIQALIDYSSFGTCQTKPKSYGITFISVPGNVIENTSAITRYVVELQKENSLNLLSNFFQGSFTESFKMISHNEHSVE